jgi:hypothetical protein
MKWFEVVLAALATFIAAILLGMNLGFVLDIAWAHFRHPSAERPVTVVYVERRPPTAKSGSTPDAALRRSPADGQVATNSSRSR